MLPSLAPHIIALCANNFFIFSCFQITLHYIRNLSLGGGSSPSFGTQLSISSTSRTSAERLNAPLREASNADLLDLLNQRLGNVSVEDSSRYDPRANAVLIMLSRNSEVNEVFDLGVPFASLREARADA